jgi:hypothetical protein
MWSQQRYTADAAPKPVGHVAKIFRKTFLDMKKLFTVGILALCSLTIAIAKNYELTLSSTTKVGSLELKPGQYTLKVQGDKAVFTFVDTAKQFTTNVKVEATDKKFDTTRVDASKTGNVDVVKDIELGGSKTRLQFGD